MYKSLKVNKRLKSKSSPSELLNWNCCCYYCFIMPPSNLENPPNSFSTLFEHFFHLQTNNCKDDQLNNNWQKNKISRFFLATHFSRHFFWISISCARSFVAYFLLFLLYYGEWRRKNGKTEEEEATNGNSLVNDKKELFFLKKKEEHVKEKNHSKCFSKTVLPKMPNKYSCNK